MRGPSRLSERSVWPLVSAKSRICCHTYQAFLTLGPLRCILASSHRHPGLDKSTQRAHGFLAGEQRQQPNPAANTSASAPPPTQLHPGNATGQGQPAQPQAGRGQSGNGPTADRMRSALLPIQHNGTSQGKLRLTLSAQRTSFKSSSQVCSWDAESDSSYRLFMPAGHLCICSSLMCLYK